MWEDTLTNRLGAGAMAVTQPEISGPLCSKAITAELSMTLVEVAALVVANDRLWASVVEHM